MEEDMNGFRNSMRNVARSNSSDFKCRNRLAAKALRMLVLPVALLAAAGCRRTPSFSGPPDIVVPVVMKKWSSVPERIEVRQGTRVELVVSTADVEHGLAVPGLAINEPVQPRQRPAVIRFLAQDPGTYPMRCS